MLIPGKKCLWYCCHSKAVVGSSPGLTGEYSGFRLITNVREGQLLRKNMNISPVMSKDFNS